ncbi:MAG: ribonuclease III, partial [Bacteroidia bacterium]|nr:ribonuclease III [Bacteroidia bacterium]
MFSFIINSIKLLNGSNKDFRKALKKITGFCPGNIKLYETAFIHRSASNIKSNIQIDNNERLEYLGDAVFDTIIADYLY